jgi:hypothetical protein
MVAVGSSGRIGASHCRIPSGDQPPAVTILDDNHYTAVQPGRTHVVCDSSAYDFDVRQARGSHCRRRARPKTTSRSSFTRATGRPPFDFAVERRGTPRWLEWSGSSRGFRYSPRRPRSKLAAQPSANALVLTVSEVRPDFL